MLYGDVPKELANLRDNSSGSLWFARPFCRTLALCFLFQLAMFETLAQAATVQLNWNQNSESDITGYRIYYGTSPNALNSSLSLGNTPSHTLTGLSAGQVYYFAVSALNNQGLESERSATISVPIPSTGSPSYLDSDGDGISDVQELSQGTNPYSSDTDNDGVSDSQELLDGSNPIDRGSGERGLGQRICSEWNGFLGGLWNVLELVNLSTQHVLAEVILYGQDGVERNRLSLAIAPGEQRDTLIHDLSGRMQNSYGNVCVEHDGGEGSVDGRMVYYKPARAGGNRQFDFAFAMPFARARQGAQFVPFNTYQPSSRASDASNLVANWIQLTNLSGSTGEGNLSFYGLDGGLLQSIPVVLPAGARQDFSGHQFGRNITGIVRWEPTRSDLGFQLRNVRYLYDNPFGEDSFHTAFQLEGLFPSGDLQTASVSTEQRSAVVEVSNVLDESVNVTLKLYQENGDLVLPANFQIAPHASFHIILDGLLGANKRGMVSVQANKASSVIAVAMHYARNAEGAVYAMYGLALKPSSGTVLRGSFNTFIQQQSQLVLHNPTNSSVTVNIDMRRSSGTALLTGFPVTIASHGNATIALNSYEAEQNYGVVTVHAPHARAVSAWILRSRSGEFIMPSPVRE